MSLRYLLAFFVFFLVLVLGGGQVRAATVSASVGEFGGTTVITFDEPIAGWSLNTQYAPVGVLDFNAPVRGAQGSAMAAPHGWFGLPQAVSGERVGFMGASLAFAGGVDRVGVWLYKGNGTQYLNVLDAQQQVLGSLAVDVASTDSAGFDFVGLRSDRRDIRYVVISNEDLSAQPAWSGTGYAAFYDDLMFTPITAVPEPATWAMLALCLGLMGVVVRRRR